jgi:poly(A)-specific ribonuclease
MEVVKSNFESALQLFEDLLPRCQFLAFDLEMTGVRGRPETWGDNGELRYAKLRRVATTFSIIQVGVCLFVPREDEFIAYPFNFYLYPDENYGPKSIVMETSGIAFNKQHRMDFNKWIYEGIPYVTEQVDAELYARFVDKSEATEERSTMVLTRETDKEVVNSALEQIEAWLSSDQEAMEIPNLNAFLRKFIIVKVKNEHPGIFVESVATGERNRATIVLTKHQSEQRLKEQHDKYYQLIGFRRVFKLLKQARKPVIGHAMICDLLFLFNVVENKLPETLAEFKRMVNNAFPLTFDTKHLFNSLDALQAEFNAKTQYHGLKEIYSFLQAKTGRKLFTLGSGFEKYQEEIYAHEAGFDALMTGMCLAYMQQLEGDASSQANLLPLFKSFYLLNLAGADLREPVRCK